MLRLRPYKKCDAKTILGWIKDEYSFRQWSADRYKKYPPKPADMIKMYESVEYNDSFFAFTAFDENSVVGHLTMRFTDDERKIVRFGFVIVDDSKRGNGYGKEMLQLAIKYSLEILKVEKITLGVFKNNTIAYNCYKSVGFKDVTLSECESYKIFGECWNCTEMEYEVN